VNIIGDIAGQSIENTQATMLSVYNGIRDIEMIMYLVDSCLYVQQQSAMIRILSIMSTYYPKYRSDHVAPCSYSSVTISSDIIRASDDCGIISGNHLVIATTTAHPFTSSSPLSLTTLQLARNTDFIYQRELMRSIVSIDMTSVYAISVRWPYSLGCDISSLWTMGSDTIVGSFDSPPDIITTNVAIYGFFIRSRSSLGNIHSFFSLIF
jgi:hypothetical protein